MVDLGKHALAYSHVTSAFNQPIFHAPYRISPRHPPEGSSHASQALLDHLMHSPSTFSSKSTRSKEQEHSLGSSTRPSFEEHAVNASITPLSFIGDALLRVTHSGYVLELTLLDWTDGRPICWEFRDRIVPMPAIFVAQDASPSHEMAHVYVLLENGSLFSIRFPLIAPFFHDENWLARREWFSEHHLPTAVARPVGGETGSMLVQEGHSLIAAVNNGAIMRVDLTSDSLKERVHYPQHHSLLSKMFRTSNSEADAIVSIAHAPSPGDEDDRHVLEWTFSISRDKSLRIWDKHGGNIVTVSLPTAPGATDYANTNAALSSNRSGSVTGRGSAPPTPASPHTPQLLPPERRTLIRTFYTDLDSYLRLLVFIPLSHVTQTSAHFGAPASAGFFVLYRVQGNSLIPVGEKVASDRTVRCNLRDFQIMDKDEVRVHIPPTMFSKRRASNLFSTRYRKSIAYGNEMAKPFMR